VIEVAQLTKTYGDFYAVQNLSFSVGKGEVVGFLGPNGAGKSTTLRILSGFLGMTSGRVTIDGHNIVDDSARAREKIGYMPEAVPLYGEMRVIEYLRFRAELKGVPSKARRAQVEQAMVEARVDDLAETLISKLSKGYRQRVGLADALVSRPPILILDEPTAGLDPNQIREVRELIKGLGERHTLLLSTHILSEVEATCQRAVVVARGRLVAEGTLDDLRSKRRSTSARLVIRPAAGATEASIQALVAAIKGVARVTGAPASAGLVALDVSWSRKLDDPGNALEEVAAALYEKGHRIREAVPARASLDEVFAQLTGDTGPAETPEDDRPTSEGGAAAARGDDA
jgi:ABC-2 type transport system ATP-binding protein